MSRTAPVCHVAPGRKAPPGAPSLSSRPKEPPDSPCVGRRGGACPTGAGRRARRDDPRPRKGPTGAGGRARRPPRRSPALRSSSFAAAGRRDGPSSFASRKPRRGRRGPRRGAPVHPRPGRPPRRAGPEAAAGPRPPLPRPAPDGPGAGDGQEPFSAWRRVGGRGPLKHQKQRCST